MLVKNYFSEISEPYEFEKENPATGAVEIVKKLSDCVGSGDKSLLKLVKIYLQPRSGEDEVEDEDEDQAAAGGESEDSLVVCEENGGKDDVYEMLNSELQAQQQQTAAFLTSKKNKKQQKYKEWRMDMLRMDDLTQMRLMAKELAKMRKAKDKNLLKK
jgi:hypothetical protein